MAIRAKPCRARLTFLTFSDFRFFGRQKRAARRGKTSMQKRRNDLILGPNQGKRGVEINGLKNVGRLILLR